MHGPETAFGPNPKWFEMAVGQIVKAAVAAVGSVEPASASVANGTHNYGTVDQREPDIYDTRLNVMAFKSTATGKSIATMVQWNSHPETTLGWTPPVDAAALAAACQAKGWTGSKCTAKDRYFTGEFIGVLEARLKAARGGEVAYFNGALGVLTGPLHASTWLVDKDHPAGGDGRTVPAGAFHWQLATRPINSSASLSPGRSPSAMSWQTPSMRCWTTPGRWRSRRSPFVSRSFTAA